MKNSEKDGYIFEIMPISPKRNINKPAINDISKVMNISEMYIAKIVNLLAPHIENTARDFFLVDMIKV